MDTTPKEELDNHISNPMCISTSRHEKIDISDVLRHEEFKDKQVTALTPLGNAVYLHWEYTDNQEQD